MSRTFYDPDGDISLICAYATEIGFEPLHKDCTMATFNAWDKREFWCLCKCHDTEEQPDA